jgi:hypothetical protein
VKKYKRYSSVKKYKGRARGGASGHKTGRHVAMLRPITLKPNFVLRRVQAFHSIQIQPGIPQWSTTAAANGQAMRGMGPLYIKIRANSIWPYAQSFSDTLTYAANSGIGGGNGGLPDFPDGRDATGSIKSNEALPTPFVNDAQVNSGTAYPGIFDPKGSQAASPGQQWHQQCVLGSKVTVTATPIINLKYSEANVSEQVQAGSAVGLFGFLHHGPATQEPLHRGTPEVSENSPYAASTIATVYNKPFSKVRKIQPLCMGGGQTLEGDQTGSNIFVVSGQSSASSLVINYAPKKAAGVKDITDNPKMWSTTYPSATGYSGTHPVHEDYIYIGIDKLMVDTLTNSGAAHNIRKPMQAVNLQIRLDAMVAFRSPASKTNFAMLGRGADAMDDGGEF